MPPVQPMLAKSVKGVPTAPGFSFEPKWDPIGGALFAGRPSASV